jgi:hypothetical protein
VASSSAGYTLDSNCQVTGTNICTNTATRICIHRTWLVLDNLLPIRQLEIDLVQVSTNSPLGTWPLRWELTLGNSLEDFLKHSAPPLALAPRPILSRSPCYEGATLHLYDVGTLHRKD